MSANLQITSSSIDQSQASALVLDDNQATIEYFQSSLGVTKSETSVVADALEELSQGIASERESHELKDRKPSDKKGSWTDISGLEQYTSFLNSLTDLDVKKYEAASSSHNLEHLLSRDDIKNDDITQRFLGLLHLLVKVRAQNQEKSTEANVILEKSLILELNELESNHGDLIRASINIAPYQSLVAGIDQDPKLLRALYKETILDFKSLSDAYVTIFSRFQGSDFKLGLNYLLKAVGADLNALLPSKDSAFLARVIEDLFTLKILNGIHDRCLDVMVRLTKKLKSKTDKKSKNQKRDSQEDSLNQDREPGYDD